VRRTPRLFHALAALTAIGAICSGTTVYAQGIAIGVVGGRGESDEPHAPPERDSLRGLFGVPVAERLLVSSSAQDRLRGVVRLGAIGTPEAIDSLTTSLEQSTIITRDAKARLEAIRVLAPHAARENVRALLIRELGEGPEGRGSSSPLSGLSRGAAALALAKTGDKKALSALVGAVVQGGAGADAATMALIEYPPASLNLLLEGRRRIDPAVANLLAAMGDLRAQERLRTALAETDPAFQTAAALALVKLGDATPTALARGWVKLDDTRLRRAGAEVLTKLGTDDADEAIAKLLSSGATRSDGIRLALATPKKELVKPLATALEVSALDERERAIAAIGRVGGPEAVQVLVAHFDKPELATSIAFALARMPAKEARGALERALASASAKNGAPRRLIVRASTVRALLLQDEPSGLDAALEALVAEKTLEDKVVGTFGLVATARKDVDSAVKEALAAKGKERDALLSAVGRAALARGNKGVSEFADALRRSGKLETPEDLPASMGIALLADPNAMGLSTATLARLAEEGGPLAPLAARALPTRDGETVRSRIKRLLEGTDPIIRAHTALGLAADPEADAVSLLVQAYRFEEDATVRRAVIRALSARKEKQRLATLTTARDLDPDDGVRALARAALSGRTMLPTISDASSTVHWVSLVANSPAVMSAVTGRAARFVRPDGLVIPVVSDPDGVLIVPGVPEGRAGLTLAPEAKSGDAAAP
jgi:HEAT repeat protein